MGVLLITGPSNSGPGERQQMLSAAAEHFSVEGVDRSDLVRVDVPGRGAGEEGDGTLRTELEPAVPLLQSGSLFGARQGLQVVDAQNLQVAEAELLAELLGGADLSAVEVVFLVTGTTPRPISAIVKEHGKSVSVSKMWERKAAQWLEAALRSKGLEADRGGQEALLVGHLIALVDHREVERRGQEVHAEPLDLVANFLRQNEQPSLILL